MASIKFEMNESTGEMRWYIPGGDSFTFYAERAEHHGPRAKFHGFKQKISDAGAMEADKTTGRSVPAGERLAAMRAMAEHLMTEGSDWNRRGQGSDSDLIAALIRMGKPDTAELRAKVRAMSPAERNALGADERVKPHLDAIRAERGRGVNTDKLLNDL